MEFVGLIVFSFILLTVISGGYLFFVACVRRKEMPWLVEEEIKKTHYYKYYEHMKAADRWLQEHNAQDVSITSKDGLRLHALWIPNPSPKGTILLAHGYRSTRLVDFGLVFSFYHNLGFNILVPEQRSHGNSEGYYITFGVKESGDMMQWVNFHNENYGPYQMILSGLSMGASTVMYMADQPLPKNVRGIIADCGYTSPHAILSSVFRRVIHLPAAPTLWVAELFARIFAGFSFWGRDTKKSLANSKLPILMVHGTKDGFVPCEMTRQGYAACTSQKHLLLVEGAEHGVSFLINPTTYTDMVLDFLKTNLEAFE